MANYLIMPYAKNKQDLTHDSPILGLSVGPTLFSFRTKSIFIAPSCPPSTKWTTSGTCKLPASTGSIAVGATVEEKQLTKDSGQNAGKSCSSSCQGSNVETSNRNNLNNRTTPARFFQSRYCPCIHP
ncbi:hypothetical protein PoB_005538200 [Plakobranchus ocellatus]|uniref:Uncharacterized protein n=1 Tax=Plakobranchus ocellatus TaxID=259542 RepID=A0AAV4CCF1_9GAST|nr:hypothetical protein PoB_005538200 [Plakobranchus ocellatus]